MAVLWALACMLFAASNDLLFKFYARKDRGLGFFVSIKFILLCVDMYWFEGL